jgi:hypothetical protein
MRAINKEGSASWGKYDMRAINKEGLTLGFNLRKAVVITYALINQINR